MNRTTAPVGLALMLLTSFVAFGAQAHEPAAQQRAASADEARPPLAFRADFDSAPSESPVTLASIKSKELRFATYGPGKNLADKTWHATPPNQGGFIWSGNCTQLYGFTLFLPDEYVDLGGTARITWNTEQTGLHQLRLMIRLASGDMLVSDQSVGASSDWQVSDLIIRDLRWRALDVEHMNDASLVRGGGHGTQGGSSRVKSIEVYGRRIPRR